MCNNTNISQENIRYSFFQLFNGNPSLSDIKYNLVIPIIQRDYAQGRKNEKSEDVRTDFLGALYDYIYDQDCQSHDLDFVYGYSKDSAESGRMLFIPIDGQQRLTTLFLLHWYLAQRSEETESQKFFKAITQITNNGSDIKSRFSYRTRVSSTDFCNKLVQAKIDFCKLLKIKKDKQEIDRLSITIQDSSWFSPNWMQDPTISSMLTMLDAIHDKFKDADHTYFLQRLMDDQNPAVTFIFMNLDNYGLSDDLYIKMNSRGKPLTPFENFKAKFEQYIAKVQNDSVFNDRRSHIEESYNQKKSTISSVKQYFSFKLDTDWTNLMWAYCKEDLATIKNIPQEHREKTLENLLDKKLANFIRVILTNQIAAERKEEINIDESGLSEEEIIRRKKEEKGKRDRLFSILIQDDQRKYVSYNLYEKSHGLSPAGIEYIISAFDVLANGKEKIKNRGIESRYFDENAIFNIVIDDPSQHTFTYPFRIRFHAYIKYLILFNGDDFLNEWMHFVYSITENTITDTPERFSQAIESINGLLQKMTEAKQPSVYNYFTSLNEYLSMGYFASYQVKEEQIKAALFRKTDPKWKKILEELEQHPYFNQQIGFILEFAGIVDFYDNNKNCNWGETNDETYYENMVKYGGIASEIFKGGYDKREYAKDSIFERAMLIDYPEYIDTASNNRYNILSSTAGGNTERDHSWRVLLKIEDNNDKRKKRNAVKMMFNRLWNTDTTNYQNELENHIKNNIKKKESWIRALVRDATNTSFCKKGFIRKDNGYYLQSGEKTKKEDVELFTHTLFYTFSTVGWNYMHARYDGDPHIEMEFVFNDKAYAICIHTIPAANDDFHHYRFAVRNASYLPDPMPHELKNELGKLGFKLEPGLPYEKFIKENDENDFLSPKVIEEFKAICNKLSNL